MFLRLSNVICQKLRHTAGVRVKNVAVGSKNKFAAVFVPLPFPDNFDVNALLNDAGDEHPAKGPLAVRGYL